MGLFEKKIKNPNDVLDSNIAEAPKLSAPVIRASATAIPAPLQTDHPDFGINKAIELMRMLPDDNVELVVRVVKTTLESTNIKVATIIQDAIRKQGGLEGRIGALQKEIAGLEAEIATRRSEIIALEVDHKETAMVKDRLMLAEKPNAVTVESRPIAVVAATLPRPASPSSAPANDPMPRQDPPR